MLNAPISIGPDIVPPAFARYAVDTAAVVARSLKRVPPSCITLFAENVATRPEVAVPAFVIRLSTVLVLVAPEMEPTFVRLNVPIAIEPVIVPPAFGRYELRSVEVATWYVGEHLTLQTSAPSLEQPTRAQWTIL